MQENQRVANMADEVLVRQAKARVERTGEPFEVALKAVRETKAGQQLAELRDGSHRDEKAKRWQEDLPQERAGSAVGLTKQDSDEPRQGVLRWAEKMSTKAVLRADYL